MLNIFTPTIVFEYNFGKNLIAAAYLKDRGCNYFTVAYVRFVPAPLNPVAAIIIKLDGYDLSHCDRPYSVFDLYEEGQRYDIVITVCPKRLDKKCPNFPGQLLRLNWWHSGPDKIAESGIDRLQQSRIMRDRIKADMINFIAGYEEGQ